jgi:hypothetical protein
LAPALWGKAMIFNLFRSRQLAQSVLSRAGVTATLLFMAGHSAMAADLPSSSQQPPIFTNAAPTDPITDYFEHWYDRVHEAQATQPHWMTRIATVPPRLEEEIRYDQQFQDLGTGAQITNFDGGKGLELIPTTMNEILINAPAYEQRHVKSPADGFADWNFLTIKQRIVSAPEDKGNYILTTFLGRASADDRLALYQPCLGCDADPRGRQRLGRFRYSGNDWGADSHLP